MKEVYLTLNIIDGGHMWPVRMAMITTSDNWVTLKAN